MAIIPKVLEGELQDQKNRGSVHANKYIEGLLLKYTPEDSTKKKENLLTLVINSGIHMHLVDRFLKAGYAIQGRLLDEKYLGNAIVVVMRKGLQELFVQQIKTRYKNPGYAVLMLPSVLRYDVWMAIEKKEWKYSGEKFSIINELFKRCELQDRDQTINFFTKTQECLEKMIQQKGITVQDVELLKTEKVKEVFLEQFDQYLERSVSTGLFNVLVSRLESFFMHSAMDVLTPKAKKRL